MNTEHLELPARVKSLEDRILYLQDNQLQTLELVEKQAKQMASMGAALVRLISIVDPVFIAEQQPVHPLDIN